MSSLLRLLSGSTGSVSMRPSNPLLIDMPMALVYFRWWWVSIALIIFGTGLVRSTISLSVENSWQPYPSQKMGTLSIMS